MVMVLAVEIGQRTGADLELVRAGALLHDIGRSVTHSVMHPVVGAKIARDRNLPEAIVHIIQRHIGAGITPGEARKLGYPAGDYMPHSLEEKIVGMADKLTGDDSYLSVQEALGEFESRGLHEPGQRMLAMYRELSSKAGLELDEVARSIKVGEHRGLCRDYLEDI